ncbi:divalent-cation tolerance protein CutA [Glycomyces sp. A-F 0318]|uniref:divalent-cation tolerance protein CutA n=1 Tax=Glycomyces amatae TaxID=2881355 RepID=UPI001E35861D|nr:divalent-cation tolerance protein CutA [Glycomyces amatae]MCD0444207.1 divalent-cation tolerance protein CutA [Glycomyces amatae]
MDEICEVVVTAPGVDELAALTRRLVDDRLCACGHQVAEIRSVYRWEGEVHAEPEARVMLHTRRSLVPAVIEAVKASHPYEVPCVIALPIAEANPDYHQWVLAETRDP